MVFINDVLIIFLHDKKKAIMKNRIKIERAILDITQDELAKKIGVSRQTINSIEKGRYVPSTVLALKLSELFDKPINEFFFLEETD